MRNYLNRTEGGGLEELLDISKQQKKGELERVRKLLALLLKKASDLFIQPHKEYSTFPVATFYKQWKHRKVRNANVKAEITETLGKKPE